MPDVKTRQALPALGPPRLVMGAGSADEVPVGAQAVARRIREEFCLKVGEALAAEGATSTLVTPMGQTTGGADAL